MKNISCSKEMNKHTQRTVIINKRMVMIMTILVQMNKFTTTLTNAGSKVNNPMAGYKFAYAGLF